MKDYGGWRLWKEGVSAAESTCLSASDLPLESGEAITDIRLEYRVREQGLYVETEPMGWRGHQTSA